MYDLFLTYLHLPVPRMKLSEFALQANKKPTTLRVYSSSYRWLIRARAYDSAPAQAAHETLMESACDVVRQHVEALGTMRRLGMRRLTKALKNNEEISIREAAVLITDAIKLERATMGLDATAPARAAPAPDMSGLTLEELQVLAHEQQLTAEAADSTIQ